MESRAECELGEEKNALNSQLSSLDSPLVSQLSSLNSPLISQLSTLVTPNQVSSGSCIRQICRLHWRDYWLAYVAPLIVIATAMLINFNVGLALLMVYMVALPMVLVLLYFNYALTLEMRWSLISKDLALDADTLVLTPTTDTRLTPWRLPLSEITAAEHRDGVLILHLARKPKTPRYRLLILNAS